MATYLITGVSRGIGFEFLKQASANSANKIIGLVRQKDTTLTRIANELADRKNVHIVQGDLTDVKSLEAAADEVSKLTGGSLDYLIANAGYISYHSGHTSMPDLGKDPSALEDDLLECFKINVVSQIHLFNVFTPMILRGNVKKVIALSSGNASFDIVNVLGVRFGGPYAISKAALNMAIAKYNAEYASQGVLFMGVCPGAVNNHQDATQPSEKEQAAMQEIGAQFMSYAPGWTGPVGPEGPVQDILSLAEWASVDRGYGGAFISHLGTDRKWL